MPPAPAVLSAASTQRCSPRGRTAAPAPGNAPQPRPGRPAARSSRSATSRRGPATADRRSRLPHRLPPFPRETVLTASATSGSFATRRAPCEDRGAADGHRRGCTSARSRARPSPGHGASRCPTGAPSRRASHSPSFLLRSEPHPSPFWEKGGCRALDRHDLAGYIRHVRGLAALRSQRHLSASILHRR